MNTTNFGSSNLNEDSKTDAPCLIECGQGVSVLYKDRYLYSKYAPSKAINNLIKNLTISDNSIVLIFSPALWLGIERLIEKLPQTSKIVAIEFDNNLYNFSTKNLPQKYKNEIPFFNESTKNDFLLELQKGHYKKVIPIEFSAGTIFNKEKYNNFFSITQSIVDQNLKNKLTLIKFGRLYSKNIFKNLRLIPSSIPFKNLFNKITKPILVLGAGESLNQTIEKIKGKEKSFFILSVDAALNSILANNIQPDAIVAVESQIAIEKAYIGKSINSKIPIFCDLVGRPHIPEIINGPISFFISKYASMKFLDTLSSKNILPPTIKPLGSVGLVAMDIALKLRKNDSIKIFFSGLDFSYSVGISHAKNTMAHNNQLISTTKLKSIYNIDTAFSQGTSFVNSKDNSKMITTIALKNYSLLFTDLFKDEKNIFDIGLKGIDLGFKKVFLSEQFFLEAEENQNDRNNFSELLFSNKPDQKNKVLLKEIIYEFLSKELNQLFVLKDILSNGEKSSYRDNNISLLEQIQNIIQEREYLFIHFPDAYGKTNIQSFLNRIKIEADFFIKEISIAKKISLEELNINYTN